MSFDRPTLPTLIARIAADIESRLVGVDAKLRRQVLTVLGRALAGATHGLHGHLDWVSRQLLPSTCDEEVLALHGSIWTVPQKAAEAAAGPLVLTGTTGTVIAASTSWTRADGAEFVSTAEAVLAAGTATVNVAAVVAGIDGNTAAASVLSLVNPIDGCTSTATVDAGGLVGGVDLEAVEAWRARVIARIQAPPHGGRQTDYEEWALAVAGVTRVWVKPLYMGRGTVAVFFVCDDQAVTIIPDAGKLAEVAAYIDPLRPVTALIFVLAPTPVALDLTIAVTPNTAAVQAAVTAELADLLRREAEPGGTILLTHIREAISLAAGETDYVLTAPAADVEHADGELAVLGDITWA